MSFHLVSIKNPPVPEAIAKALEATLIDIGEDMNQYVKYLSHDTENSIRSRMVQKNVGEISWNTPYARYAYYRGHPSHAGTHLRWAEFAAKRHSNQWADEIRKRAERIWKQ